MNLLNTFVPMVLMIAGSLGFISVTSNEMNLLSSTGCLTKENRQGGAKAQRLFVFLLWGGILIMAERIFFVILFKFF